VPIGTAARGLRLECGAVSLTLEGAILAAWLAVGLCLGLDPGELGRVPDIRLVFRQHVPCKAHGRCKGRIAGSCGRHPRVTVALSSGNGGTLVHEFIHRLLCQRDGRPDRAHRLPDWARCAAADRTG